MENDPLTLWVLKMRNILFGLFVVLVFQSNALFASDIRFMTHGAEDVTFLDSNGELRGVEAKGLRSFLVELVREMMSEVGKQDCKIEIIPFPRGLHMVQNQNDYAFFNVGRGTSRENTAKWVGPLFESSVYFYKKKGSKVNIATIEDAKKVGFIAVQRGAGGESHLKKLGFTNLQAVLTQGHALKMLAAGRVDITPIGRNVISQLMKQFGVDPEGIEETGVKLADNKGYIAFSKNVPDEIIATWQAALDELLASKRYTELVQNYLIRK